MVVAALTAISDSSAGRLSLYVSDVVWRGSIEQLHEYGDWCCVCIPLAGYIFSTRVIARGDIMSDERRLHTGWFCIHSALHSLELLTGRRDCLVFFKCFLSKGLPFPFPYCGSHVVPKYSLFSHISFLSPLKVCCVGWRCLAFSFSPTLRMLTPPPPPHYY